MWWYIVAEASEREREKEDRANGILQRERPPSKAGG